MIAAAKKTRPVFLKKNIPFLLRPSSPSVLSLKPASDQGMGKLLFTVAASTACTGHEITKDVK